MQHPTLLLDASGPRARAEYVDGGRIHDCVSILFLQSKTISSFAIACRVSTKRTWRLHGGGEMRCCRLRQRPHLDRRGGPPPSGMLKPDPCT
jgi:hypothetical protein